MEVLCTSPLVECQVTCMLGLWVLEKASGERPWRTCQLVGWGPLDQSPSIDGGPADGMKSWRERFFISSTIQHEIVFLKKSFTKPWHQLEWLLLVGTPGWNRCNLSYPHVLHVFVSAFPEHHGVEDCLKFQGGYKLPRLILVEKIIQKLDSWSQSRIVSKYSKRIRWRSPLPRGAFRPRVHDGRQGKPTKQRTFPAHKFGLVQIGLPNAKTPCLKKMGKTDWGRYSIYFYFDHVWSV